MAHLHDTVLKAYVIQKIMNGMFRLRPRKTKYHAIWNVQIMLKFLENISLNNDIDISRKLVCLFKMPSDLIVINTISKLKITYVFRRQKMKEEN